MRLAAPALLTVAGVTAMAVPVVGLELETVATGLDSPIYLDAPAGDGRLFVAERGGDLLVLDGAGNASTYLTTTGISTGGSEGGFLGFAFHPNFANVGATGYGQVFLNYTIPGTGGIALETVIERVTFADPAQGQAGGVTREDVLRFGQPAANHNAGWLDFSPTDGLLYIPTGDGGSSNDPDNNGQTLTTPLAKVLRIDVDGDDFPGDATRNYAIPQDNPFAGTGGPELEEIWAWGLRNPYRDSFDAVTGDLYLGDVGQGAREEVSVGPNGEAGLNYGWRIREGDISTPNVGGTLPEDQRTDPIFAYPHDGPDSLGRTIIGGYVYRGDLLGPAYEGLYFFGDYITGRLFTLDPAAPELGPTEITDMLLGDPTPFSILSFGDDVEGELYLLTTDGGTVYRIVPEPATALLLVAAGLGLVRRPGLRRGTSNLGSSPT